MEKMSLLTDLAVFGVIAISVFFSYYRGLVREVFSLAAWIGAALVAVEFFPHGQSFVKQFIKVDIIANLVAGGLLFVLALVVFSIFAHYIADLVQKSSLKRVDRPLGVLFGFLRGAFVVFIAYVALLWAIPSQKFPAWITDARSYPYVKKVSFAGLEMLRSTFKGTEFSEAIEQLLKPRKNGIVPGAGAVLSVDPETDGSGDAEKTPVSKKEDKTPKVEGYDSSARDDLDQLIEANQ